MWECDKVIQVVGTGFLRLADGVKFLTKGEGADLTRKNEK
jgi:hypothetical protein